MTTNENFFPALNAFFHAERLTPYEFYLYSYLHASRNVLLMTTTKTNFNLLIEDVKFVKKVQDNKDYIEASLISLRSKGVLIYDFQDIRKDKKLEITFMEIQKGFEKIPYKYFALTTDPEEFMVLCAIKTFKRQISFLEFSKILDCSERHVKDMIPAMEQKGIININNGRYYVNENNQIRQEMNAYSVNEDVVVQHGAIVKSERVGEDVQGKLETRPNNWGNKDKRLTVEDYYVYLTTEDDDFKGMVENIINALKNPRNPSKKPFNFTKMERDARLKIEKVKKQQEQEENIKRISATESTTVKMKNGEVVEVAVGHVTDLDWKSVESIPYVIGLKSDKVIQNYYLSELLSDCFAPTRSLLLDALNIKLQQGKFSYQFINELEKLKDETINKNNQSRRYDEDWEGDDHHFDGFSGENLSMQDRIREHKRRQKVQVAV
jgi:hypothetical protein